MLDSRDIKLLRSDVAINCRKLIELCKVQGVDIIITSTVRDDEYQKKLYAKGRTTSGAIVTKLQFPTFHWNKAGLAFDFCPVDKKGNCLWTRGDLFTKVGKLAGDIGFSWGGDWVGFTDKPHVQWDNHGRSSNADVRKLQLPPMMVEYKEKGDVVVEKPKLDNVPDTYAMDAIDWAKKEGVLKGDNAGNLRLHDNITRQDVIVMLYRTFNK